MPARCSLCPPTTGLDTRGRCSFGGGGSIIECTGSIAAQSCGAANSSSTARHRVAAALSMAREDVRKEAKRTEGGTLTLTIHVK